MSEITSSANAHFKRWRELASGPGIRKHGQFLLMGERLVREFLAQPGFAIAAEITSPGMPALCPQIAGLAQTPVFTLAKALFNEIDVIGTHSNLLVLECKALPELAPETPASGLEVLCPLGDPSNLGALARSALAFGASKLVLTTESTSPWHPKAIKASAGAVLKLPLYRACSLQDFCTRSTSLWALDLQGQGVDEVRWPADLRLLVGEEGRGIPPLETLSRIAIPTQGVESLNATVAASIALYAWRQGQP